MNLTKNFFVLLFLVYLFAVCVENKNSTKKTTTKITTKRKTTSKIKTVTTHKKPAKTTTKRKTTTKKKTTTTRKTTRKTTTNSIVSSTILPLPSPAAVVPCCVGDFIVSNNNLTICERDASGLSRQASEVLLF